MSKSKKLTAEEYRERFESYMGAGEPVYTRKKDEVLIIQDGEEFRQCYDAHDPARRDFPKCWFVSDHGNLISCDGKLPRWLKWDTDKEGYFSYHFLLPDGHVKNIKSHNLVGLVFGSERIGTAQKKLDEKGIFAFGISQDSVNGHHKQGIKEHPERQNDPANIQFLTKPVHTLIESAPRLDDGLDKELSFMEKLSKLTDEECPKESVVVTTGEGVNTKTGTYSNEEEVSISTAPRIFLTPNAISDLRVIASLISQLS